MKKKELLEFNQGLHSVANLKGVKFSYAVARNMKTAEKEIEAINKSLEPYEGYKEFEDKRLELCKEFAKKEMGNPVIKNDKYIIDEDRKELFDENVEGLKKIYKESIDERKKQVDEFNKMLDEDEVNIFIHKVDFEELPKDLTPNQMLLIMPMIAE